MMRMFFFRLSLFFFVINTCSMELPEEVTSPIIPYDQLLKKDSLSDIEGAVQLDEAFARNFAQMDSRNTIPFEGAALSQMRRIKVQAHCVRYILKRLSGFYGDGFIVTKHGGFVRRVYDLNEKSLRKEFVSISLPVSANELSSQKIDRILEELPYKEMIREDAVFSKLVTELRERVGWQAWSDLVGTLYESDDKKFLERKENLERLVGRRSLGAIIADLSGYAEQAKDGVVKSAIEKFCRMAGENLRSEQKNLTSVAKELWCVDLADIIGIEAEKEIKGSGSKFLLQRSVYLVHHLLSNLVYMPGPFRGIEKKIHTYDVRRHDGSLVETKKVVVSCIPDLDSVLDANSKGINFILPYCSKEPFSQCYDPNYAKKVREFEQSKSEMEEVF